MTAVQIPDIGDFDEVEVIEILVSVGDKVEAEDPLITLESDKATMEIPAPTSGTVTNILIKVGDKVAEGASVIDLETSDLATDSAANESTPAKEDVAETVSEEESPDKPVSVEAKKVPPKPEPMPTAEGKLPHASPAIRRFARELGASLEVISGSGPKGRILKEDVKSWIKQQLSGSKSQSSNQSSGIPPIPEIDFSEFGEIENYKLSRIKKLSGPHLQRAWLNIPHVTHHDEADITDLEVFRKSLKEEASNEGVRITILSFVMKVLVGALKKYPNFNSSLASDGESLILKKYFNIGIAVDTPNGLIVPVVKNVDRKSIMDLARDLADISERARDGKLKPDDLKGGCISISSLGGIGGTAFTPIVNAPEVAILGISRARMTPVWDGKDFQPRLMLPLDLSYDHRVVDGAEAARFAAFLTKSFGDVRRLSL
jgi:pyruvate dehydrogenase E2 component (dihydrolipoamide acetyltransferase)